MQTDETSGKFEGSPGNTYKFFVIATDNVGNTESFKSDAELTVSTATGTEPVSGDRLGLRVIPNPAKNPAVIEFYLPQAGNVTLSLHNLSGQKVMELYNDQAPAGLNQVPFDATKPDAGVYLITLQGMDSTETVRVVVE